MITAPQARQSICSLTVVPSVGTHRSPTHAHTSCITQARPLRSSFRASIHATRRNRAASVVVSMASQVDTQAFTIVGAGRVGLALAEMGTGTDVIVRRGEAVDGPPGPIIIATRNDALQSVVDATPANRRKDLVFIQNGMLQPWLDARNLGNNTQVLVFFAVAAKGDPPLDGKTEVNPEGLTAAHGPHATAVAARLHAHGLSCKVLDRLNFQKSMLEKLVWICAFMLVGAKHGGVSVGEVESTYNAEVSLLITELAAAGETALGIRLDPGTLERLNAYARSVAHFPTAVKEFEWRNGWFYDISQRALQEGRPDPCPTHTAWLRDVGAV